MALNTVEFVNELIKNNYTHLCVVPCSFAKNVINEAINNKNIEYTINENGLLNEIIINKNK